MSFVRRLLLALGLVFGVILALQVVLEIVIDPDFVAARLNGALGVDGPLRVEIGGIDPGILGGSLTITDLALVAADTGRGTRPPLTATVPRLTLGGIDRWTLVVHGGLRLDRLVIERPRIRLEARDMILGCVDTASGEPTLADRMAGLPPLTAGVISIDNARLSLAGTDSTADIGGFTLSAGDVEISAAAARDHDRILFSRWITAEMAASRWRTDTVLHELGPLRLSTRDSLLWVESFVMLPCDSTGAPAELLGLDSEGTQVTLGPLTIRGLAWRGSLARPRVTARQARLERFTLHVFSDRSLPSRSGGPPSMPHDQLGALACLVTVDSLRLESADVRYSERPLDGGKPGTVLFGRIRADITGFSNDPEHGGAGCPTTVELTTAVADTAMLHLRLEQNLLADEVSASITGTLTGLPASALNSILTPLEGTRFTSGRLDTLAFEYALQGREADGEAAGMFRNIHVELVGDDNHSGLVEDVKGLVGNLFVLRSDSDDEAATGTLLTVPIRYTRLEGDTYLKFLWAGLRSGLKELIGV